MYREEELRRLRSGYPHVAAAFHRGGASSAKAAARDAERGRLTSSFRVPCLGNRSSGRGPHRRLVRTRDATGSSAHGRASTRVRGASLKVPRKRAGPVPEEVLEKLGAEIEDEFKWIPGGVIVGMPLDKAGDAHPLLKDAMDGFLDSAMTRVRRSVSLEDHTPEAIYCISEAVGRELPQPEARSDDGAAAGDTKPEEDDVETSREPKVRGRAPIFENGQRSIASLISDVERGVIALPDLQRPFVWEDTKVRDLLDSLFVGFPVGTLVFWHTADDKEARALGAKRPHSVRRRLSSTVNSD